MQTEPRPSVRRGRYHSGHRENFSGRTEAGVSETSWGVLHGLTVDRTVNGRGRQAGIQAWWRVCEVRLTTTQPPIFFDDADELIAELRNEPQAYPFYAPGLAGKE